MAETTIPVSEAIQRTMAQASEAPNVSFKDYAKTIGVDTLAAEKAVQVDIMNAQPVSATTMAGNAPSGVKGAGEVAGDVATGAGQGLVDVTQNILNFGLEISDGVENTAADHGMGSGDLITGSDRIDWSSKLGSPNDSLATRSAREITKYAAPMVATMGAGAGVVASMGAGAVIDMLTLDPKQERLSTMLRDSVPELKNYPIAYGALDYLSNKPDDTALEGRLKNSIEGVILGGGTLAAMKGISATFSGVLKAGKYISTLGPKAEQLLKTGAKPEQVLAEVSKPVKMAAEAEVAAAEKAMGANAEDYVQQSLYDYKPTKVAEDGSKSFNLNNSDVVGFAHQYAKANPQTAEELFRGPKAFSELSVEAQAVLNNQSSLESLLSWKLGDRPLTDAETKASQFLMSNTYQSVTASAAKVAAGGTEEDMLHFANMLDTFKYVDNARTGAGSEAGRALNAHKLSADLANTTVEEFNKMLGNKGRAQLASDAVKKLGGKENLSEIAKQLKAISELPDADVAAKLSEAVSKGGFEKTGDMMQNIAINGMLSSPKTAVANFTSNTLTATNTVIENYTAAAFGAGRSGTDKVTFDQANGYIKGMMNAFSESMGAAGSAFRTGTGGPANVVKGDIAKIANSISAKALDIPVEQHMAYKMIGNVVDKTGLVVGLPTRINATADAFWGTMLYRGKVHQEAIYAAESAGLKGTDYTNFINKKVSTVTMDLHETARDFAKQNTFSRALDGSSFAGKADELIGKVPAGRVVFPFFKTTANIVDYTVQHSPLAPLISTETKAALQAGGRAKDLAVAKITLGTSLLGTTAYLASQGIVTGPETRNYRMKQALEESGQGWQPDSIKIGDSYYGMNRIDPFNSFLRLGAVLSSLRNHMSEEEYSQAGVAAASALVDFMTPEMLVDGYGRFFDAVKGAVGTGSPEATSQFIKDQAGKYIPFSALQRDIKNMVDPYKPDTAIAAEGLNPVEKFTHNLINRYKSISPWHSEDMPIQRNIFGEPLVVPDGWGPDFISPFSVSKQGGTEIMNKLSKLAGWEEMNGPVPDGVTPIKLSLPSRIWAFEGTKVQMTPAEYERYVMYSAGIDPQTNKPITGMVPLRNNLEQIMANISPKLDANDITPNEYTKLAGKISNTILEYKKFGQMQMLRNEPKLMERWQKAADAGNTPINKQLEAQ